jgi:hypothetical protein
MARMVCVWRKRSSSSESIPGERNGAVGFGAAAAGIVVGAGAGAGFGGGGAAAGFAAV